MSKIQDQIEQQAAWYAKHYIQALRDGKTPAPIADQVQLSAMDIGAAIETRKLTQQTKCHRVASVAKDIIRGQLLLEPALREILREVNIRRMKAVVDNPIQEEQK